MKLLTWRGAPRDLLVTLAAISSFLGATTTSWSTVQVRVEVNKELAHILSVVQVEANPELTMEPTVGKSGLISSPDRKHSAYILCVPMPAPDDPQRCAHRVHFDDYIGPKATIYQVRGEPELEEVNRPIDNLKWVNSFTLSYERWSNPHFGHRYLIDVRTRKQSAAYDLFG